MSSDHARQSRHRQSLSKNTSNGVVFLSIGGGQGIILSSHSNKYRLLRRNDGMMEFGKASDVPLARPNPGGGEQNLSRLRGSGELWRGSQGKCRRLDLQYPDIHPTHSLGWPLQRRKKSGRNVPACLEREAWSSETHRYIGSTGGVPSQSSSREVTVQLRTSIRLVTLRLLVTVTANVDRLRIRKVCDGECGHLGSSA